MNGVWLRASAALGALAGGTGVVLAAVTTHALKPHLDAEALTTLDTASRYLLIHGLLLMVIARWQQSYRDAVALKAATSFAAMGIVLFCGGLSASIISGVRWLGAAAPLGGSALIGAWLACLVFALTDLQ